MSILQIFIAIIAVLVLSGCGSGSSSSAAVPAVPPGAVTPVLLFDNPTTLWDSSVWDDTPVSPTASA